jgi:hypothetical protein
MYAETSLRKAGWYASNISQNLPLWLWFFASATAGSATIFFGFQTGSRIRRDFLTGAGSPLVTLTIDGQKCLT